MQSPHFSAQTRLLVVAPHPDDETLGCGLLIQQVLAAGGAVHLLLLTDGDNNPWPQRFIERRLRIGPAGRQRWGERRRNEVRRAIERLGVPVDALESLGWRDMDLTRRLRDDTAASIAALRAAVSSFKPTLVCFPALADSHPDHGAAHVLCRLALADMQPAPAQWAYPVHGAGSPGDDQIRLEPAPATLQRKLQALAEHRTQMTLSERRMRQLALGPECYVVPTAGTSPQLPWRPPVILRPWLRVLVATLEGVRDWPWPDAPIVSEQGGYRLAWPAGAPPRSPAFAKLHLDWPSPWIFDHWGWHALN